MRAFFVERLPDDPDSYRVRWNRIAGTGAITAVLLWLLAATGVWGYLRWGRDVYSLAWTDAAFPHRWDHLRVTLGNHYLQQANVAMGAGEIEKALYLYRSGLSRSPLNTSGRLGLARLYLGARRPELAMVVLTDSLERNARDSDFLRSALHFLLEYQYDLELRDACDRLLTSPALSARDRPMVTFFAATVAFHRGNYDRAETFLRDARLESSPEGTVLLARMDAERGYRELALLRLDDLIQRNLATDEAYVLVDQIRGQLGQQRELELNATLRLANNPLSHAPRIGFLYLNHSRQRTDALARDIEAYLITFARDQTALLALADFAANTGYPDLAARLQRHFAEQKWPTDALALMTAESNLAAGRYAEGLESVRTFARLDPEAAKRLGAAFDSLQAVALLGLNRPDEARFHLEHLLAQPNLRAENLRVVAHRLTALGHAAHARLLLERATTLDPLNQLALTELVRLEATGRHFEKLPAHTRRLLEMRKPAREVLELVVRSWGSDLNLLHPEQAKLLAELRPHLAHAPTLTLSFGAN